MLEWFHWKRGRYKNKERGAPELMGIYLNPGNRGFWESVRSEIYVDKTGLLAVTNQYMNTEQKFIC